MLLLHLAVRQLVKPPHLQCSEELLCLRSAGLSVGMQLMLSNRDGWALSAESAARTSTLDASSCACSRSRRRLSRRTSSERRAAACAAKPGSELDRCCASRCTSVSSWARSWLRRSGACACSNRRHRRHGSVSRLQHMWALLPMPCTCCAHSFRVGSLTPTLRHILCS